MAYCRKCGASIFDEAVICPKCGVPTNVAKPMNNSVPTTFLSLDTSKLVILVSTILFMIISFLPVVFTEDYWKADIPGIGIYGLVWQGEGNMFYGNVFFGIVVEILALVTVVILALSGSKSQFNARIPMFTTIAALGMFILSGIMKIMKTIPSGTPSGTASSGFYGYTSFELNWGFYVGCVFLLVAVLFSFKSMKEEKL